jgi:PAS domain S-box-containing protein
LETKSHTGLRHRVLVVDGDRAVRESAAVVLADEGLETFLSGDAEEAWALAGSTAPCLALIDVALPAGQGLALARRLRDTRATADVLVLLLTANASHDELEAGLATGAVDYIKKPFDSDELRFRVRGQIRVHELRQRQRRVWSRLDAINHASHDAIVMTDQHGLVTHWNHAATTVFGWSRQEMQGKPLFTTIVPERYQALYESALPRHQADPQAAGGRTVELVGRRKGGEHFPMEVSIAATKLEGQLCTIGIVRDITARKHLETELQQARKLEAVGQLASGIAHEINTPSQFVGDSLRFLADGFNDLLTLRARYRQALDPLAATPGYAAVVQALDAVDQEVDLEYLEQNGPKSFARALDGVGRISAIVRSMKEFAHPDQRKQAPADLGRALQSTLNIARNEYKYIADLDESYGDLPPVTCFVGELNQVFLNLLVNAAHAIGEKVGNSGARGRIGVRTSQEGESARIEIEDSGCGIPEAIRGRIFEPFFTTKEIGRGSGQGLAIARSVVVDKHGGSLTFASEVGRGTTFTILLPIGGRPGSEKLDSRPNIPAC